MTISVITRSCQNHDSYQHRYMTQLARVKSVQEDSLTCSKHPWILGSFAQCRNLPSKHWRTYLVLEARRKWIFTKKWWFFKEVVMIAFSEISSQIHSVWGQKGLLDSLVWPSLLNHRSLSFIQLSPISSQTVLCFAKIPFLFNFWVFV